MSEIPVPRKSINVRPEVDPWLGKLLRYTQYGITYARYINRPAIWPALSRKIANKLTGKIPSPQELKAMKTEAEAWCVRHQVSYADGLAQLGITELYDLNALHPAIMDAAAQRADAVPVWMGGGGHYNMLYTLCQHIRPRTIVETGVASGWSSLAFLIYLHEQSEGSLYSVDLPILELNNDGYVGVAVPDDLKNLWSLYRMADREALPKIVRRAAPFDLVHYDSDKSIEGRDFAYPLLWNNLQPGGLLVSDDIGDNMAFARFTERVNVTPIVISDPGQTTQGILVKPQA